MSLKGPVTITQQNRNGTLARVSRDQIHISVIVKVAGSQVDGQYPSVVLNGRSKRSIAIAQQNRNRIRDSGGEIQFPVPVKICGDYPQCGCTSDSVRTGKGNGR